MKFLSLFLLFVLSFSSLPLIICEVVCSEEVLARELLEDISDNGKLDCLREISSRMGLRLCIRIGTKNRALENSSY